MPLAEPLQATARQCRIVVVDQDEVARTGCQVLLRRHPQVAEVVGFSHDAAIDHDRWCDADVVVLDPVDPRRPKDQIPGAAVVERVRAASRSGRARVVVISATRPDDPVRRRLREAGADAYFQRAQVHEVDRLHRAVLAGEPDDGVPEPVDREAMHRLGITARSRVNRGVEAAFAERLVPGAGWVGPRGRDRLARRTRFNDAALLTPVGADGRPPDRAQDVPSLAQIQRFVAWATRIDQRLDR